MAVKLSSILALEYFWIAVGTYLFNCIAMSGVQLRISVTTKPIRITHAPKTGDDADVVSTQHIHRQYLLYSWSYENIYLFAILRSNQSEQ
jgi:hypothetical protein